MKTRTAIHLKSNFYIKPINKIPGRVNLKRALVFEILDVHYTLEGLR